MRALGATGSDAVRGLGTDLVKLLTGDYLRADHPLLHRFGVLLTLIDAEDEQLASPAVAVGDQIVRRRFRVAGATIGGVSATVAGVRDLFAPGQFQALSDEEKLSLASFESMPSGAVIGARGVAHGTPVSVGVVYEQKLVTAAGVAEPDPERVAIPLDVFVALTATPPVRAATFTVTGAS